MGSGAGDKSPAKRPLEDENDLVGKVRRVCAEVAAPNAVDVDRQGRFPSEVIAALKREKVMSSWVPRELGGAGGGLREAAAMSELLGTACASSGMIFAMHQIQVACLARHANGSQTLRNYLTEVVEKQLLLASCTSEVGVGGSMRTSITSVKVQGDRFALNKDASTISYGEFADGILVTARRSPEAAASDQVLVLVKKGDYTVEKMGAWDTMGMRGTCSPSFKLTSSGPKDQIMETSFADISGHTMVPVSHVVWANMWLGIANAAVRKARAFVRAQARSKPGVVPPAALRLAEVVNVLQTMRSSVHALTEETHALFERDDFDALSSISFALKMNNLKLSASQLVVQIVHQALLICGIMGYKNDSKFAMGRHLRDAHSAALAVGNERIYATNAQMLLVLKDD